MGISTKIINVLRDDSFGEILDIFKNASAKEVIFVLPKTCRAFKDEKGFMLLSEEASNQDKSISFLCSNPDINKLAKKYNFDVLLAKNKNETNYINTVNEYSEEKTENDKPWGDQELPGFKPMGSPEYHLVKAIKTKKIEDVLSQKNESSRNLKIKPKKEKPSKIGVKTLEDIDDIWKDQERSSSIWADRVPFKNNLFKKRKIKIKMNLIAVLAVAAAVLLGTVLYISTGSAKIIIKPQKHPLDFKLKVLASDKYRSIDPAFNRIPGQVFTIEKSVNQTFNATGQKDAVQKAKGKITVHNELTSPQPLVATTRFESESGLIFRTLKTITVPAAKIKNGKTTTGAIEVEVIADKPGQEYNISPDKFVIIAFREKGDTERYQNIYGRSEEPMRGGINGKATIVSESDYNSAKEILTKKVTDDIQNALNLQTAQFKLIDSSAILIKDPVSTTETDNAASDFTMTILASIKTVGFKEEDLYKLVTEYVKDNDNLTVIPDKIELKYDKSKLTPTDNLEFDVIVTGNGYTPIDETELVLNLLGRSEKDIRKYLQNNPQIESAKIVLSPFWINKVPKNREKVSYQLEY